MEKKYEIGYIYKLICSETQKCYFGSTSDPIKRYNIHRNINNRCISRILKDPKMHILEIKKNISKSDLEYIEKYYILNNTCVNKQVPKRTYKEWYKHQKENNPNYLKELYQRSEGKKRNVRTREHCECGGVYIKRNLKIHLQTKKHNNYINNI